MLKYLSFCFPVAAFATYKWREPLCFLNGKSIFASEQTLKLEQVQVVFRHGARAPIWIKEHFRAFCNVIPQTWQKHLLCKEFPIDIKYKVTLEDGTIPVGSTYDDEIPTEMEGGCITGQLTYCGQKEIYDLGRKLANKYIVDEGLIPHAYNRKDVFVRSSYYERAVQSAIYLLAGMYSSGKVNETINIQTKIAKQEDIVGNLFGCKNFIKWFEYVTSNNVARGQEEAEKENHLNILMGKIENQPNASFNQINDLIRCRKSHGIFVPKFLLDNEDLISQYELKSMQRLLGKGNANCIRNTIGAFLETLCTRIDEGIEGTCSEKMLLYSAHD